MFIRARQQWGQSSTKCGTAIAAALRQRQRQLPCPALPDLPTPHTVSALCPIRAKIASRPRIEGCAPKPCVANAPASLAKRMVPSSGIPLAHASVNAKASPAPTVSKGMSLRRRDTQDSTRGDDEPGSATTGDDHLEAMSGGACALRLCGDLSGRHGNERGRLLRVEDERVHFHSGLDELGSQR